MERTPLLSLHGAHVRLGTRQVLRGVDLSLQRGEVLALLGASGCGKTTLLRCIAGLAPIDSGRILLEGRDLSALPVQARGLGFVFQHYALFPNLTVRGNVEFGPLADGLAPPAAAERAQTLLEMVGMGDWAGHRPAQLSGGQRQRVALARALARHPALLLMDEPFSALDEHFRAPLRRSFRQLQRDLQQSCLIVTHDRDEAYELADRVAVMIDGEIAQCAAPADLWTRPASSAVAKFLGAFNLMPAMQRSGGPQTGWWSVPVARSRLGAGQQGQQGQDWRVSVRVTDVARNSARQLLTGTTADGHPLRVWLELGDEPPALGQSVEVVLPHAHLHHLEH
ncbi:ABC transporter ATP-binding protein [Roseateles sp. DB2]|uniref:ABC transporter ATP-binding protein n=1 Tax=Roseateles sp. DB2 TaxID=3453717 RepID=UPI003EED880F